MLGSGRTSDATYVDPMLCGTGAAEIDALIGSVHARFPGFHFALEGKADGHGDNVRFSWAFGPEHADALNKGTDFIRRGGDRIDAVTGFLDKVPAAV